MYVYSTADDVFASSKLVLNCFVLFKWEKEQMEFVFLSFCFMKEKLLLIIVISFLLLVCRDESDDDNGSSNGSCDDGWNTPYAYIHVCHVTNRFNTTIAMSIWHCPFVRVFSDDTWEQNIRLLLIIIVRPYWLLSFFFSICVILAGYVILVVISCVRFSYEFCWHSVLVEKWIKRLCQSFYRWIASSDIKKTTK